MFYKNNSDNSFTLFCGTKRVRTLIELGARRRNLIATQTVGNQGPVNAVGWVHHACNGDI